MAAAALPAFGQAQVVRIGAVDFYGLNRVSEARAVAAVEGLAREPLTIDALQRAVADATARLKEIQQVRDAHLAIVCCLDGRSILFVGIAEEGASVLEFGPPPDGAVRLPAELITAGDEFMQALAEAAERGELQEDDSQGHALLTTPAAASSQQRFLAYAAGDLQRLRDVLRQSADAQHRALAAQVLAYAPDKRAIIEDLVYATRDPSSAARNNAMRALGVLAGFSRAHPELDVRVPWQPFVELLTSLVWSDRNKASLALMELTASRDAGLLTDLRTKARGPLLGMARWKSKGHAEPALWILGRIAGLADADIRGAIERGDREFIVGAMRR